MVKKYTKSDYADLQEMFQSWGLDAPAPDLLPKTGFIVKGLAAGFLYLTDSKIAIIDNYVCNKESDKMERNECLNEITEMLIIAATELGMKIIKCDSNKSGIKKRAIGRGATELGEYTVFMKEIENG